MDNAETLVSSSFLRETFSDSMDYAEMVLNKEIVDSEVINYQLEDIDFYKNELVLGYILCQEDLTNTIYSFIDNSNSMFIPVDELYEAFEKAFNITDEKITIYLEAQEEKGVMPLRVIFGDTGDSMDVAMYGASLFRAAVVKNVTEILVKKMMED